MNRKQIKNIILPAVLAMIPALCACGSTAPIAGTGGMIKAGTVNVKQEAVYTDESKEDTLLETFSSADGLCEIKKYASYYDVTLDYENGSPAEVGASYAALIREAVPGYGQDFEPYLYENIRDAFSGRTVNYEALEERIMTLEAGIPEEYRQEIESFAKVMADGEEGYSENGVLSYIEVLTMQMIPDALRPTACSALSLGGSMTATGERITMRNLEWSIGSSDQMTKIHAVTHMKKADRSLTGISMLGILDIITAINDDGVMLAILDIGSSSSAQEGMPFVYEGKKCYTFELRYALEEFDNARDAGEFLLGISGDFTWCNNILATDKKDAFCCENATSEVQAAGRAKSVLRGTDTELMEGLKWDHPDALCIVNSFAAKGNKDSFTGVDFNLDRFEKYNKWVSEKEVFSVAGVKAMMAQETVDLYGVVNVHNSNTVHTVIVDYATGDINVAFTTEHCAADIPEYVKVGKY